METKRKADVEKYIIIAVGALCSLLFLYTGIRGQYTAIIQRSLLLMFGLVLVFLRKPLSSKKWTRIIDYILIALSIFCCLYVVIQYENILYRSGVALSYEWIIGGVLILLIFEGSRRSIGIVMPIIAVISLLYAFFGPYMPAVIAHRGFTPAQMLSTIFLTTEGIWGTCLGVGSTIIVFFIIFASFLAHTGANDAFLNLSKAAFGTVRGGPAKMAVVASGIFGTISGSAPANVASTGTITIPLMKKTGYSPEFAGAVEAVASSGGQLVPPIMGSAAFIMAETLGVSYTSICKAAILPAFLYYFSAFIMVDLEARKTGLHALSKEEVPVLKSELKLWWPCLVPLVFLIVILCVGITPSRAAMYGLAVLILFSCIRKETRLNAKRIIDALSEAAFDMAPITVVCGVAGIIIGVLGRTGLGPKLAEVIVTLASGRMIIILILTMCASIIMGMGLPTVACYILLAASIAPAIHTAGAPMLAAHMFVFYFGIISAITPPVAIASYTAAGISKGNVNKLSWLAVKMAMPAFILPYMFVFAPELLLISGENSIIRVVFGAIVGTFCMAAGLHGYLLKEMNMFQRIAFVGGSLCLISGGLASDIIGLIIIAIILIWHYLDYQKAKAIS